MGGLGAKKSENGGRFTGRKPATRLKALRTRWTRHAMSRTGLQKQKVGEPWAVAALKTTAPPPSNG